MSIKFFQSRNDNRYSLIYYTDINRFIKHWYWYDDISDIMIQYNCVMINSIIVPEDFYTTGVKFLKEFCDIMTVGDRVIIFDMEELMNTIHDINYICDIENLLCRSNFINIPIDDMHTYDIYIYLNTKGAELLSTIDAIHGVYYD